MSETDSSIPTTVADSTNVRAYVVQRGLRAFLAAFLVFAALNALSFFVRSDHWSGLFGNPEVRYIAIGFPSLIWEDCASHGRNLPDGDALAHIGLIGLVVSCFVGLAVAGWTRYRCCRGVAATRAIHDTEPPATGQFSLKTLLLFTTIAAILLGVLRSERDPWRAALVLVSLAGPAIVLLAAQLSRRLSPRVNLTVVTGTAVMLTVAAAVLAQFAPDLADFTRGVLAVFVCWTPQFCLVAGWLLWFQTPGEQKMC